ncbi:M20/M25/M40 family metallo-hydrolase [Pedobacter sp. MC2016-14]|uniref:M20/M25/M40 family metallo-hydrolase n=1 Tax=Pedobacter sp. MC2016-14 TaxID=2897327 RepID=UPI001E42AEE6|nr:M20/M25/M40 family metallo-hydrolase [Pedobacter sp. MC2016-14]MCD0488590.1 M20/M25/M40 family metallo-hydrolase [Pedobacter sp. MC2016-14]
MIRKNILPIVMLACSVSSAFAQEKVDLNIMSKIRQEGLQRSEIMAQAFYLTDVNGPRLSSSPGLKKAQVWAVNTLKGWGLKNVNLEPWGEFGQGWEVERTYVAMNSPYYHPIIAIPRAWSGSTAGLIKSDVVVLKPDTNEVLRMKGKLKGRIVIFDVKEDTLATTFKSDGSRFTDEDIAAVEAAPPLKRADPAVAARIKATRQRLNDLLYQEQVALVLSLAKGRHGTVFMTAAASFAADAKPACAELDVSGEDYLRILRLVKAGHPVRLEADIKTKFIKEDTKGYNVIAEIPGTDPKLKNEVVMLGAHLDSWHLATGATDNASGVAVMMEAVRIIKKLGLNNKRTIRIALWSSEEQGLYGSKNYVAKHFGDVATKNLKPAQKDISAYYNLDNGAGKIRGIYLQSNPGVKPIFEEWLKPFHDLGATYTVQRNAGSTDHISFDALGIPGFEFTQDKLEYFTRTHHTNQDTYDRLIEADLKQAAVVVAAFVYNTAQREEKLPRKPLTKN